MIEFSQDFYENIGNKFYDKAEEKVRLHAIGIALITDEGKPQVLGSGTLVSLDDRCGVITAAHVIKELEGKDSCHIITFSRINDPYQPIEINLKESDFISNDKYNTSELGPDVGFF